MPLRVQEIVPAEYFKWDQFVSDHAQGTPFHLLAWRRTIEHVFPSYRPIYLAAFEGERIQAVLPLFAVKNILIGKALISSPFAVYGGILAASDEAKAALRDHVADLGRSMGVQYVELRNRYPEQLVGFESVSRYVTFTQDVGPDEEKILESIPRKVRYMVRKSLKHPFTTRVTTDPAAFEDLYTANLRRLGTPAFPRQHFTSLLENYRDRCNIREVILEGKVIAAVLTFYFRNQVLPYYAASDPAFNEYAPNNYMYFDQMRWAGQNGYNLFDFGRSKKVLSGSFDFKAHWGMKMEDLPYEMLLVRRKELPNFSPNNPKFQWAIGMWQRMPLPVTRIVGPWFLRLVP